MKRAIAVQTNNNEKKRQWIDPERMANRANMWTERNKTKETQIQMVKW